MIQGYSEPICLFLKTLDLTWVQSLQGLGRSPGEGHSNLLQYSCLENPHGQRSLAGYSPLGHKESDTTQQLSTGGVTELMMELEFELDIRK